MQRRGGCTATGGRGRTGLRPAGDPLRFPPAHGSADRRQPRVRGHCRVRGGVRRARAVATSAGTCLLTVAHPHLRTWALAVPSSWNVLSPTSTTLDFPTE